MRSVTGYEQAEAPHIKQSELCASCHTLITEAYGPDGEVVGSLPEQMNYQEWQHSAFYAEQRSCQSCHMPRGKGPGADRVGARRRARQPGAAPVRRRQRLHGADAQPLPHRARRDGAAGRARGHGAARRSGSCRRRRPGRRVGAAARRRHARRSTSRSGTSSGHKFPTGYPSRRTWLHVTVRDGQRRGGVRIGRDRRRRRDCRQRRRRRPADVRAALRTRSRGPDQVQIYEPILGDPTGVPTTGLLTATQYLKDNRLLPRGFDKATAPAGDRRLRRRRPRRGFHRRRRSRALRRRRCRRPARTRSTWSCATSPSATAGRTTSRRYDAAEPKRFVSYYTSMSAGSSVVVATATAR